MDQATSKIIAVPSTQSTESVVTKTIDRNDAKFLGSFAPGARAETPQFRRPWYRRKGYFLSGWTDARIWRSAIIELIATAMLTYLSGQIAITIEGYRTPQVGAYIGISNIILLSLFIYAVAPASGAHINPLITWTAILTGLCSVPRGMLYLVAQLIGGALGGAFMIASIGFDATEAHNGGGCFFDAEVTTVGQAFALEMWSSYTLVFLAWGVGLDPRQAKLFGHTMGPLLVGTVLGLITFGVSGVASGSSGANMNPARCFGYGIARQDFTHQWIWWVAPAVAGMLQCLTYNLIPPYHAEEVQRNRSSETNDKAV